MLSICLSSSHQGEILCMTVSHNNEHIVTGSRDRFITVLRLESGEVEHSVEQHTDAVTSLALTQDDILLISGWSFTYNLSFRHVDRFSFARSNDQTVDFSWHATVGCD